MARPSVACAELFLLTASFAAAATPLQTLTDQIKQCRRDLASNRRAAECDPRELSARLLKEAEGSGAANRASAKRDLDAAFLQLKYLIDGVPLFDSAGGAGDSESMAAATGLSKDSLSSEAFDRENERRSGASLRGLVRDMTIYLFLKDARQRQAFLTEFGVDVLVAVKRSDPNRALASLFGRRFDDYLTKHRYRDRFVALSLAMVDGRLKLAYKLKDESIFGEDLGPLEDWLAAGGTITVTATPAADAKKAPATAAAAAGGGGEEEAKKAAKVGNKASKAASSLANALGAGGAGGSGSSGGARGGGNSFRGANPFARLTAYRPPINGQGPVQSAQGSSLRPSARAGRGLSPEGASSAPAGARTTAVPIPKNFSSVKTSSPGAAAAKKDDKPAQKPASPSSSAPAAKGAASAAPAAALPPPAFGPIKAHQFPTAGPSKTSFDLPPGEAPAQPRHAPTQGAANTSVKDKAEGLRDAVAASPRGAADERQISNYDAGPIAGGGEAPEKSRSLVFPVVLALIGLGLEAWRRKILQADRRLPWRFD